jgi:predicted DCC family thiol-disulfide oxidoreductase YuxK
MKSYYIFYDDQCPICQRARQWIERQATRFPVHLISRVDPVNAQRFPGIRPWLETDELVVASSDGEVWCGAPAWLVVLYTLEDHWEWSFRLASPALQPAVYKLIDQLSQNRIALAHMGLAR